VCYTGCWVVHCLYRVLTWVLWSVPKKLHQWSSLTAQSWLFILYCKFACDAVWHGIQALVSLSVWCINNDWDMHRTSYRSVVLNRFLWLFAIYFLLWLLLFFFVCCCCKCCWKVPIDAGVCQWKRWQWCCWEDLRNTSQDAQHCDWSRSRTWLPPALSCQSLSLSHSSLDFLCSDWFSFELIFWHQYFWYWHCHASY